MQKKKFFQISKIFRRINNLEKYRQTMLQTTRIQFSLKMKGSWVPKPKPRPKQLKLEVSHFPSTRAIKSEIAYRDRDTQPDASIKLYRLCIKHGSTECTTNSIVHTFDIPSCSNLTNRNVKEVFKKVRF